jgi:hypothetical protein
MDTPRHPLLRPGGVAPTSVDMSWVVRYLIGVTLFAVTSIAVYQYLPPTPDHNPTVPRIFAGFIGLFGSVGMYSLAWVLIGPGRGPRSRKALLARARSDAPPEDGQLIVVTGVVRADRPLVSPLGGVPCAAYDYQMSTGARETIVSHPLVYWGYAAQPLSIDTPARSYPVWGVPMPGPKATQLSGETVVNRARSYVRSTGWETVEFTRLGMLDAGGQRLLDESTTGTRRDFAANLDEPPDVATLTLEETLLPVGATVSALGQWSASHGAIVRPSDSPDLLVVVVPGGPEALDGRPLMPQSINDYVTAAMVSLVAAVGTFYFAQLVLPSVGALSR